MSDSLASRLLDPGLQNPIGLKEYALSSCLMRAEGRFKSHGRMGRRLPGHSGLAKLAAGSIAVALVRRAVYGNSNRHKFLNDLSLTADAHGCF